MGWESQALCVSHSFSLRVAGAQADSRAVVICSFAFCGFSSLQQSGNIVYPNLMRNKGILRNHFHITFMEFTAITALFHLTAANL